MKAATYSRFSTERQDASSITQQQRATHERAAREGWAVVADFVDEAITGSDANRPAYVRMQAAALAREFDVLLLNDLSRLARDSMEQERVIRRLEFAGVRIITCSDGYDSVSAARKIQRQAAGMINEVFRDNLSAAVHRGQKFSIVRCPTPPREAGE
ncbi:MAG: recombinase family protein [Burkholderiales bacterium]|nr:recombinase family protein [Burkholderiales bacterium]